MKLFAYASPSQLEEALRLLDEASRPLAGGTDLLTMLDGVGLERLIDLKSLPGLDHLEVSERGLHLGALVTLTRLETDGDVRRRYPALAQAAGLAASPQLRNAGTVGGNLAQEPRCWYYRGPFDCWMKGGEVCFAREGDARHHAIFPDGPCLAVQPSDLAQPLLAYGATLRIDGPAGEVRRSMQDHFRAPSEERPSQNSLDIKELITAVDLPPPWDGERSVYLKAMERAVWGFALASLAIRLHLEGRTIRQARVVLGAVAPTPLSSPGAEEALRGAPLTEASFARAADAALEGVAPHPTNRYKVPLVRGLFLQAAEALGATPEP